MPLHPTDDPVPPPLRARTWREQSSLDGVERALERREQRVETFDVTLASHDRHLQRGLGPPGRGKPLEVVETQVVAGGAIAELEEVGLLVDPVDDVLLGQP